MLLSRSHSYSDLILAIDGFERRLFEQIDGHRTIDAIVGGTRSADRDRARAFFERLWWYDQVVFDSTNAE